MDRQTFVDWYETTGNDDVQVGAIPGSPGRKPTLVESSGDCSGYAHVKTHPKITKLIKKMAPRNGGRFYPEWFTKLNATKMKAHYSPYISILKDDIKLVSDVDGEGRPLSHYMIGFFGSGTLAPDGSGSYYNYNRDYAYKPAVWYPMVSHWYQPDGLEAEDKILPTTILLEDKYKGFVACGYLPHPDDPGVRGEGRLEKAGYKRRFFIGSEDVGLDFKYRQGINFFFDVEGAILVRDFPPLLPRSMSYYDKYARDEIQTEDLQ